MVTSSQQSFVKQKHAQPQSDDAHQPEDQDNEQDKPQPATWVITPAGTVWPSRQRSDQQDDQNN